MILKIQQILMITRWWDITGPWAMTACLMSFLEENCIQKPKK